MKSAVALDDLVDVAPEVHASLKQLLTLPVDVLEGMGLVFQVRGELGKCLKSGVKLLKLWLPTWRQFCSRAASQPALPACVLARGLLSLFAVIWCRVLTSPSIFAQRADMLAAAVGGLVHVDGAALQLRTRMIHLVDIRPYVHPL